MNIETFKQSLPFLFNANVATLVHGFHGIGKSQAVAQYASENDLEFIDLRLGTQEVGDLLGLADFERDKKGNLIATKFMRPDWFPVDPESKGIIFLDEINRARRDVLQAVFQLVLDKRLHRYELPKGWHVIGAMNPNTDDYITTDISDKAFMDRFCHVKLSPTKTEFFKYAKKIGFDPEVLEFLKDQPELLQSDLEEFNLDVTPSRRSWMAVDRIKKLSPPMNVFRELTQGLVGTTASVALMKKLATGEKPINAEEVVNNYSKVKKTVQSYANAKTNRQDALKYTCDSLMEYAQENKDKFTKEQKENISAFLWDIPRDLSFDLCRELYRTSSNFSEVITENMELLADIATKRNLKVKGVNSEE